MFLKVIHNHLKTIGVLRIDDDLVEVAVDASSSEDILQGSPYSFEYAVVSVEMHADICSMNVTRFCIS